MLEVWSEEIIIVVLSGAAQFDELTACLKSLEYPFESCVKDLRSQVVRECCITIAFLSQCLRNKVSRGSTFHFLILINIYFT